MVSLLDEVPLAGHRTQYPDAFQVVVALLRRHAGNVELKANFVNRRHHIALPNHSQLDAFQNGVAELQVLRRSRVLVDFYCIKNLLRRGHRFLLGNFNFPAAST